MSRIVDYSHFLSQRALRRKPSAIRELQPLMKLPGMISLGGGMPNPTLFPLDGVSIRLRDDTSFPISNEMLHKSLQYSSSYGLPELVDWLKTYQQQEHNLKSVYPNDDWDVCVTTGSQDAMCKTFDMLLNESDTLIVEDPTYSGAISALNPIGCRLLGIPTDIDGMIPEALEQVLNSWDSSVPLPKTIYLIPTGQNPSGSTLSLERKKKIYQLASKHNLLILEDDPYYNLQLPAPGETEVKKTPTLASMDVDGRVLRFDSFSKIVSSGLRLGWVTGPRFLIERIQFDQQSSELHTCGLSQAILLAILNSWGKEGWKRQMEGVQKEYTWRRDTLVKSAEKYLKGLAEWKVPSAGMFLWIKLNDVEDTFELIKVKAVKELVLMVPGQSFSPSNSPSPYVRASYSTATEEEMDQAMQRLATLLKREQGK